MGFEDFQRYCILLKNDSGRATTDTAVKQHIAYLRDLAIEGKLVLCGPFTDYNGGMVIVKAASKEEAIATAKRDPFISGNFRTYEIRTWLLSCEENSHLGRG